MSGEREGHCKGSGDTSKKEGKNKLEPLKAEIKAIISRSAVHTHALDSAGENRQSGGSCGEDYSDESLRWSVSISMEWGRGHRPSAPS